MKRIWLAMIVACVAASNVRAQDPAPNETIHALAIQYSHLAAGHDHTNGWQAEFTTHRYVDRRDMKPFAFGFDASVNRQFGTREPSDDAIAERAPEATVRRTTVLGGVHVFPFFPIPVYVRALAGYSRRTERFAGQDGVSVTRASGSPVIGAGFGLSLPISDRIAIRVIQVDFLRFPNDPIVKAGHQISTGASIIW